MRRVVLRVTDTRILESPDRSPRTANLDFSKSRLELLALHPISFASSSHSCLANQVRCTKAAVYILYKAIVPSYSAHPGANFS